MGTRATDERMEMMKNSYMRLVVVAISAGLIVGTVLPTFAAGGMLRIKGSDTVLPLAASWAEGYMKKHPNVMISVNGGGSGVGLASLINGTCDIADSSREVKPKEISQGRDRNVTMTATVVAKDGIAVIVNPKNSIDAISKADLGKLYSGARTWKEVGGSNLKVVPVGRDSSSGTYVFFQDSVLKGKQYRSDMLTMPSNNAICQAISQDEGAVGYVGLAYAKEFAAKHKVKIIPVSGVAASDETVRSGKYPLWRPLYCYTNGKPSGLAADYLKYVTSDEGQTIVEKVGYVHR
jgi:phosphate transport system substrate-binding protein